MRLDELIAIEALGARCVAPTPPASVEISSLAYDSRRVQPGALFFCVSGLDHDGHDFAGQAIALGAAALVVERELGLGVPEVLVGSARAAMGPIAARFHGDPTTELRVVGVTGTNGKTTTTYLVRALLEALGQRCGLLGTVKSVIGGHERAAIRTTPEAIDLQADLRAMLDGGERACAMEVSSHALALGRTDAVGFAAAIFTNLTQDHLDFHRDMEDYFQAKRRLFISAAPPALSVVNVGDPYGRRLAGELGGAVTFALEGDAGMLDIGTYSDVGPDYLAHDLRPGLDGTRFQLRTPAGSRTVALPMPGRFNVSNALGALAAVHALGGDLGTLVGALEQGVHVPGRFQSIDVGQGFAVIVDYAHTPDSLENVLRAARELAEQGHEHGRVICVFGAGGDRDAGKRPLMGRAAARLADVVLVTSDNPRSEDPRTIIEQIMAGVPPREAREPPLGAGQPSLGASGPPSGAPDVRTEVDRRAAIEQAIDLAGPGDVLVIAGKGHEQGQELAGGRRIPFDDAQVAREALGARVVG